MRPRIRRTQFTHQGVHGACARGRRTLQCLDPGGESPPHLQVLARMRLARTGPTPGTDSSSDGESDASARKLPNLDNNWAILFLPIPGISSSALLVNFPSRLFLCEVMAYRCTSSRTRCNSSNAASDRSRQSDNRSILYIFCSKSDFGRNKF